MSGPGQHKPCICQPVCYFLSEPTLWAISRRPLRHAIAHEVSSCKKSITCLRLKTSFARIDNLEGMISAPAMRAASPGVDGQCAIEGPDPPGVQPRHQPVPRGGRVDHRVDLQRGGHVDGAAVVVLLRQ